MPQIGLFQTNLGPQECGHAIAAALLLGSRLSQGIHIHWKRSRSFDEPPWSQSTRKSTEWQRDIPAEIGHEGAKPVKIGRGLLQLIPPKIVYLQIKWNLVQNRRVQIKTETNQWNVETRVEDYKIVKAICVVISPFCMTIFIPHMDHWNTLVILKTKNRIIRVLWNNRDTWITYMYKHLNHSLVHILMIKNTKSRQI